MSQQIINLGVGPDSQTGDSLYVAFNKVNTNFTELYSVFDGNGITTINANVIYSNNIVTSVNVRTGNLFAYGNIESLGYVVTSGIFYPNGAAIGSLASIDSNLVPITSNLYTVGNVTNQFTQGYFSSNITLAGANVTVRNGMLYVNGGLVEANYSNANVASYLPVYNGNIAATVTTASQPYITSLGTLTGLSVSGNTVISGNLDVSGTVTYLNVRDFSIQDPIITLNTGPNGAPLLSNNSFDSGVRTYYYDSENRAAFFGRANDTGYFEYYSNVISETGNIITGTYGTVKTGNLVLTGLANIAGNVTGSYFLGNGRYLTGIDATLISDGSSNVKVYSNGNVAISSTGVSNVAVFTPIGGNINGDFFITGTIKALNYIGNVQGNLSAPGLDTQVLFNDNSTVGATTGFTFNKTANTVSVGGNINSLGNINVAGYKVIDSTGNIVTSRLVDSGVTAATYGNASAVPVITVDSKGRITSASTTAVAGVNNVTYNSSTGNLTVFTSAGTNFSVDIGVGTADSPIFSGLSVAGNTIVNGLSINTSATIGTTLGVVGNLIAANLNTAGTANVGQVDVAGYNVIDSTGNVVTSRLIDSGVVAGTYGNASAVPVITVDSKGRITSANTTAVAGVSGLSYSTLTGNLTISTSAGTTYSVDLNVGQEDTPTFANAIIDSFLTVYNTANVGQLKVNGTTVIDTSGEVVTSQLKNSGVTAGIYGNAGIVPVFSVDSKGRVDGVTNVAIDGISIVSYNSSIGNLSITSKDGTARGVDIGVGTSDSPIFAGLSVAGNTTVNALTVNNSATIQGTLGVTGNITAPWIAGNITGNISAPGTTWQVLFNDGNVISADSGLTFNSTQDLLTLAGNLQANALTTNAAATIGTLLTVNGKIILPTPDGNAPFIITSKTVSENLNADLLDGYHANVGAVIDTIALRDPVGNLVANGIQIFGSGSFSNVLTVTNGIQNTIIGNVIPSRGYFTILDANTSATVNQLTVNTDANIGGGINVTGNATVGNVSTNNLTVSGIIAGNITVSNVSLSGGLQNTPVGNAIPSTGNFTTLGATGNISAVGLTLTGSEVLGSTLQAQGGIQNTKIGNVTPETGKFTTIESTSTATVNSLTSNGAVSGTTAQFTTINGSANATVNALTVNGAATIGSTLGVVGNLISGNLSTGKISSSDLTNATGTGTGAFIVLGGGSVTKDFWVGGNLYTTNLIAVNSSNISVQDPLLYLVANTPYPYSYEIGVYSNFFGGAANAYQHTGVVRDHTDGVWKIFSNAPEPSGTTIDFTDPNVVYDSLRTGSHTVLGALIANSTGSFGSNVTVNGLTVNNSATVGGTLGITGNINATSATLSGSIVTTGPAQSLGGLQATPIGNASASTGQFTTVSATGNITGAGLTSNGSITAITTISGLGGLQATPIGNVSPSTAIFTSESVSGNSTVNGLTVNNSATVGLSLGVGSNITASGITLSNSATMVGTLQASGGIQATPIGNTTPSTGKFTTLEATSISLSGGALSIAGNITANGLTINNSATIGSTLGVVGNINGSSATLSGSLVTTGPAQHLGGLQDTPIGNVTASSALFTTIGTSGNITLGSGTGGNISGANSISSNVIIVTGNATVGNLTTAGNISASFLFGNGSQLTGIDATSIQNGNSNVRAYLNGPVTVSSAGTANVLVVTSTSVSSSANITAPALTSNGSITAQTTLSALGGIQATPIGNVTASSGQFTSLSATGNVTGAALTSNGSITAQTTLSALGGLQATPIGNVTASSGQFTSLSATGNVTGAALTSNGSITAQTTLSALGGIQATPIGNVTASSGQFTTVSATGNVTGAALTSNSSITAQTTMSALGGLQATPIGNVAPSTAIFTSLSVSGNATTNALTVNTSATVGDTLGVTGNINGSGLTLTGSMVSTGPAQHLSGLQATPIGNAAPSTALFTTAGVSGNITANALTINNSATVGGTLGVTGNIVGANITVVNGIFSTVQASTIGNTGTSYTGSTYTATGSFNGPHNGTLGSAGGNTAIVSTLSATGAASLSSLQVNNAATVESTLTVGGLATVNSFYSNTDSIVGANLTVVGNLVVSGNVITTGSNNTYFTDSIIELHTLPNLANLTFDDGKDIGIRFHYYKTQNDNAFLGWQNSSGYLEWFGSDATEDLNANIISGSYGTFKTGEIILANATPSTGLSTGALQVNGGASFSGNIYANGIAYFGNTTVSGLAVNTSATIGSTLGVTGNINGTSATLSGSIVTTGPGQLIGGLQATPIGNAAPSTALFTTVGASGNATVAALTVNGSATVGTTLGVAGNINGTSATLSGSMVSTGPAQHLGGLQATPIGNATASTGQFTTVSATGNVTAAALTSNASITAVTTLSALGGLQATPIGNVSPSTAIFTSESVSGNSTVNALTVNNSATVGTTLGVTGNLNVGGLSTSGNILGRSQLLLGVTNDTYGPQYLKMQNRDGQNGPLFDASASSVALVDFSFKTINAQRNIRFETRGGANKYISSSDGYEFQIGQFTGSPSFIENPYVVIANTGLLVRTSTVSTSTSTGALLVQGGAGVTGNVTAGNVTTAGIIRATATTAATSNVTGAVIVSGGVGVAGNVYVGQRVGFVAANSVSAVYQVYNGSTNSLDTIFG